MSAPLTTTVRPRLEIDIPKSLAVLRHGPRDPSVRHRGNSVLRATWTPHGPAAVCYEPAGREVIVTAWGPGAEHALAGAPDVLGGRDDLSDWNPGAHPLVREIDRRFPALRMVATGAVFEAIVPTVLEQKVTSFEAHESWRRIVWSWGEEAPGGQRLRLPPPPQRLAGEPYFAYHRFGVEKKRTDIIRQIASRSTRLEEALVFGRSRLEAFDGIGPWTSAKVAQVAWADADAVAVGDYHLAPLVVYAFTGKRGGDDDAMLELLEPFRPHRGRAARLLKFGTSGPPARGPKRRLRDVRSI
ncbi:MAG: DNA-3-methyladenine glycosylase 2 family protein [Actinomycetota bacterium]